ncbi:MAG TPA: ribosome biogenesis GTP-binding protein YihA/YsxC [Syntrophales bacterium]|nr:ribosome biogenesis GTP-binding protein YihA/YsxC [Syntrophales bacterium]HPN08179.1 ribosome biogenesis GTP-binding protein YihA/YsxC [Syntrophales bacterium]HPX81500.1 ribosome biogenesis GTP-binding protein YihA/YsxC [Syntrophales bacterium]HQB13107.1 ribosome biogenesis GTP-binding protein YihA/YsxC [Syntrophales bacterium]
MKIRSAEFVKTALLPSHYPPPQFPEIAFAGRSNVGKSTLINTLANRVGLARASRTPGRTQAINFFLVNERFCFVDLPGYGFARVPDQVRRDWGPMVEAYLAGRENLTIIILILDIRRDLREDDRNFLLWMEEKGRPWQLVLTKTDKLSHQQALTRRRHIEAQAGIPVPREPILFSARTGQGRGPLWRIIEAAAETP